MHTLEVENALELIERAGEEGFKAYRVQISEYGMCSTKVVAFPRPAKEAGSEWEFVYAMMEIKEEVNKLLLGNSMYFQPIRDDKTSKGIITRIL